MRTLIRDIREYRTLSRYTLRSLAKYEDGGQKSFQSFKKTIEDLRRLLGEDYLDEITGQSRHYRNKVIIAIENVKKA